MASVKRVVAALAAAGVIAPLSAARAQGPDVIVGELPDTSFYTSSGAINGMHAWSVGTTSCNLGNQPLEWISSTNRHPVISQNMYRLLNGRFEQIGQAFLKHGFTALQGNVCSTCTAYPNGSHLGAGCSDPYSSSLNGGQSGLGPKSEVNAATGFFPYPFTNIPFSGTLGRRLQARQTDLALPGALYFVASMYIAPDDIEQGNGNNNESYRRVAINANFSLSLQGTTQRTKPAIYAWADNDAGVTVAVVDVPGDGRFLLGYKVTDNGNGTFHYEYALQNLRSDRSGRALSVPVGSGVNVSNVGFHDVDYHSGEPYDLTDWTASVDAQGVSWGTQTFAQNVNANALRWDTVYNFRFDADAAPASGSLTLDLFKPGTPTSVTIPALVPAGGPPPPPQPPVNDACAAALVIGAGPTGFTTDLATTDGPGEPGCFGAADDQAAKDVWYRYTAPCAGTVGLSTCGSAYDTRLAVYAACPSTGGTTVACNDDSGTCGSGSGVSFAATNGGVYVIRVGGAGGAGGAGTLTVTPPNCAPPGPVNDACAAALSVSDGVPVNGTTVGATNDGTASCGSSASAPDVWYAYTPATSAAVTISTCNTASYDTVLSVLTTCGGTQVACLDDTSGCGLTTRLVANLTGGVAYRIRVAGYNGASGTFTLSVTGGGGGGAPPANNDCANRAGVGIGSTAFTTVNATTDGPAHASCLSSGQNLITKDVWFNHPATATGNLVVSVCGATYDTFIAVYNGYGCADFETRLMGCNDDFACPGGGTAQSQLSVPVVAGTSYTIRIGGFNNASGSGTMTLSMQQAPTAVVYALAFESATAIPGIGTVENEDIVTYNSATGQWAMLFDGSDVGIGGLAIDGLAINPAGELLLSFAAGGTVPGLTGGPNGTTVDESDIVRFIPTSTGAVTAGSFVFYFDGSDVGLTTSNENIDAITLTPDGRLVISMLGSFNVNGVSGEDEDLVVFNATSLGASTAGTFAMYFDGSDVGLGSNSSEDVDGASIEPDGTILLSTIGSFSVTGLSGNDEDVFAFRPTTTGGNTTGTFAARLDLSTLGIGTGADVAAVERMPSGLPSTKPPLPLGSQCRADFDADTKVTSADFFLFVTEFVAGAKVADFDDSGVVESADFFAFLAEFLTGCP